MDWPIARFGIQLAEDCWPCKLRIQLFKCGNFVWTSLQGLIEFLGVDAYAEWSTFFHRVCETRVPVCVRWLSGWHPASPSSSARTLVFPWDGWSTYVGGRWMVHSPASGGALPPLWSLPACRIGLDMLASILPRLWHLVWDWGHHSE